MSLLRGVSDLWRAMIHNNLEGAHAFSREK